MATTDNIELTVIEGVGKESKKPYKALKIKIGDYEKLVFEQSFTIKYIEKTLNGES